MFSRRRDAPKQPVCFFMSITDYNISLINKKILVIKLLYIGDTLSVNSFVKNLRKNSPSSVVDVMVNKDSEGLLAHNPFIRKVWKYDRGLVKSGLFSSLRYHLRLIREMRKEAYDIVISLSHGDRSFFLSFISGSPMRVTNYGSSRLVKLLMNHIYHVKHYKRLHFIEYDHQLLWLFGIKPFDIEMQIHIPESVNAMMVNRLESAGIVGRFPKVVIHPGARKKMRQWKLDRFAEIAHRLRQKYHAFIILVGAPDEESLVKSVEEHMGFQASYKSNALSLLEMAALFSCCNLFIGNDSGPGHIAAAVDCSTLTLFGPNFPDSCRPFTPAGEVIFKNLPCCGCRHEESLCVSPQQTCMDLIEVEEVWEKVEELLIKSGFSGHNSYSERLK